MSPGRLSLPRLRSLSAGPAITVSLTLDYFFGHTTPNATLTATLKSGALPKGLAVAIVDGLGWFGQTSFFDQGRMADIAAGDTVEFFVNGVKTTVTLPAISGGIDPATDVVSGTISGVSLPANITILTHSRSLTVTTDAFGNFSTDWTSMADIVQDDRADVAQEVVSDIWATASFYPQNSFTVYETWNGVWGYMTPGETVTVTIRSMTGTVKESGTAMAQAQWGGGWWYPAGVDVVPGDQVEVQMGGETLSSTVSSIIATVDLDADAVSGIGPANSSLWINFRRQEGTAGRLLEQTVSTVSDGSYNADFSVEGIGRWQGWGYAVHADNPHADTAAFFWAPYTVVDQTYDDVVGRANVGASIAVTLTDSGGAVKDVQTPTANSYHGYYQSTFSSDVVPGDTVQVVGGGISATIPITILTVTADRTVDMVSGQAPPDASHLRVGLRETAYYVGAPSYEQTGFSSDGSGLYAAALGSEVDVRNGLGGEVHYHTGDDLDEHIQAATYYAPYLLLNPTFDMVQALAPIPGVPITLTLWAADGNLKASTVITGWYPDPRGWFRWTEFYTDGQKVDIVPGDKVVMDSGTLTDSVTAIGVDVIIDPDADLVTGTGPAWTLLELRVNWGLPPLFVPTDGQGHFMADFSATTDIRSADRVQIFYTTESFNRVVNEPSAPYLRLRVNQTHDWVDACTSTGATVEITLTDALSNVKGTASGVALRDGGCIWAGDFDWGGSAPDIIVGDRVAGSSSDGSKATATVITITGQVDAEANTLSGQVLGVSYPATMQGEIWEEGATWPETETDDQGYFTLDFTPFDIQPETEAAAWYIHPDGNWVGAVFRAPRHLIRVTSTADSGPGTLRQALLDAANGDTITFDPAVFPPSAPVTIFLTSALSDITQGNLMVDASNAGVILDGSALSSGDGFHITSNGNVIKGVQILYFPHYGIRIDGGAGHNLIGGSNASPGGACTGDCNFISGNGSRVGDDGVRITGSDTMSNTISGNFIGVDASGTVALGNHWGGVVVNNGAQWNIIGGNTAGKRNLISGNGDDGITIDNPGTMYNTVAGNYVGTDVTGSYAIPNRAEGISLWDSSSHTWIRNNLVSGNSSNVTIAQPEAKS